MLGEGLSKENEFWLEESSCLHSCLEVLDSVFQKEEGKSLPLRGLQLRCESEFKLNSSSSIF